MSNPRAGVARDDASANGFWSTRCGKCQQAHNAQNRSNEVHAPTQRVLVLLHVEGENSAKVLAFSKVGGAGVACEPLYGFCVSFGI